MCPAAAKQGDRVLAVDVHVVLVPGTPPVPTPLPHPFSGPLSGGLSTDVTIAGKPAAVTGSTADNVPAHIPTPPGASFQSPPANRGTVQAGSPTVTINGKAAARAGDPVLTCNDPADVPAGTIVAAGTVLIGP
jgi:uncharacterized Zn-binding protein involved in type VI secretion